MNEFKRVNDALNDLHDERKRLTKEAIGHLLPKISQLESEYLQLLESAKERASEKFNSEDHYLRNMSGPVEVSPGQVDIQGDTAYIEIDHPYTHHPYDAIQEHYRIEDLF